MVFVTYFHIGSLNGPSGLHHGPATVRNAGSLSFGLTLDADGSSYGARAAVSVTFLSKDFLRRRPAAVRAWGLGEGVGSTGS